MIWLRLPSPVTANRMTAWTHVSLLGEAKDGDVSVSEDKIVSLWVPQDPLHIHCVGGVRCELIPREVDDAGTLR